MQWRPLAEAASWRRAVAAVGCFVLVAALAAGASTAEAQPAPMKGPLQEAAAAAAPSAAPITVSVSSPRAALKSFSSLCEGGHFAEAARYLDAADPTTAPESARRLKAVLDRRAWIDLDLVSATSEGRLDDGLPPNVEQVASLAEPSGAIAPVQLERRPQRPDAPWIFTRATVERINDWYAQLDTRWVLEHLPAPLLATGPFDLLVWQWLALPLLAIVALIIGWLASKLLRSVVLRAAMLTSTRWDDLIVKRVASPITVACTLAAFASLLPLLALYEPAAQSVGRVVRAGFFLVFFWLLWRGVDVLAQGIATSPWAKDHPASRSLLPIGARIAKVVVVGMAIIAVLSELGYPVASLVAGLGLGGLALALAAQKTVENLFGAFSIGVDQPFREGDFVRVEDCLGTVESVGLRSTRIRTLDRTVVTIPNGKLAEMRLETYAARDRIRFSCNLGLSYGTTTAQVRRVLGGIESCLRAHPRIWPDELYVRLTGFSESALSIEVTAWFIADYGDFTLIRQEMLLAFMEVVEGAGATFALPARELHMARATAPMQQNEAILQAPVLVRAERAAGVAVAASVPAPAAAQAQARAGDDGAACSDAPASTPVPVAESAAGSTLVAAPTLVGVGPKERG